MTVPLITNCGLTALRNITSMKDISVRTLLNLAEDNGIKLWAYRVLPSEFEKITLPAILHRDNHFTFIDNQEILDDFKNYECTVLLQEKLELWPSDNLEKIKGATWVAAGVVAAGAIYKGVQANQQDTIANRLKPTNYVPPAATQNKELAQQQANATTYAGQSADEARNNATISSAVGNVQRNARSATDVLNSAANIEGGLRNKMGNDIASRYQQFKQNALNRLMSANNNVGSYQNQDYWNYINYQRQLKGAAMQNRFGAANDLGGAGVIAAGGAQNGGNDGLTRTGVPSNYFSGTSDYNFPSEMSGYA